MPAQQRTKEAERIVSTNVETMVAQAVLNGYDPLRLVLCYGMVDERTFRIWLEER